MASAFFANQHDRQSWSKAGIDRAQDVWGPGPDGFTNSADAEGDDVNLKSKDSESCVTYDESDHI